ncbi:MAG: hypothetical protein B6I24_03615 [Bacteroidetes bacterium 4572_128]|nr:MAG: hypothetical protein B6I24_03615 [Bacteroidetes bacterium 4572_128]
MKNFFIIILIISSLKIYSQTESDFEIIKNRSFENKKYDDRIVDFGVSDNKNKFIKNNPLNLFMGSFMFFYQKIVSEQFFATCLYEPTCSAYSRKLIKEFGIFKGIISSADRLSRCNKISATGIHHFKFDKKTHKVHEKTNFYK